jgi:sporulation protein YabP
MIEKGKEHRLVLEDRKVLMVNRVTHVDNFNENQIVLDTELGGLDIRGENLDFKKLNLDDGTMEIHGKVKAILYSDGGSSGKKAGSLLKKLFK